jgi:hypothetical protein
MGDEWVLQGHPRHARGHCDEKEPPQGMVALAALVGKARVSV